MSLLTRLFRRRDPWARIPTLTDLNGPRFNKHMGKIIAEARRERDRAERHARLQKFLALEGVIRRP